MEINSNKFRLKREQIIEEIIWGKQRTIISGKFIFLCPSCLTIIIDKIYNLIEFEKMRFNKFTECSLKIKKTEKNIAKDKRNNILYLELLNGMMESYMEYEKWIRLLKTFFSKKLVIDACRLCLIKI